MNRPIKMLLGGAAILGGLWLGHAQLQQRYMQPRAVLKQRISDANTTLARFRTERQDHFNVQSQVQQYIDRTLGGDLETADHNLRTRLNRLVEQVGLQNHAVSTKAVGMRESPARSRFSGTALRALREEPDFFELEATITTTANFEQALRLIESIDAQPWIQRIDHLRLDSRENGARFNLSMRLTTLFLPKRVPRPNSANSQDQPPAVVQDGRFVAMAKMNPFEVPPAPTARAVNVARAQPPVSPFDGWFITGIASAPGVGGTGAEIWLLNRKTGETRRLAVGETWNDATLVAADGEIAEFDIGRQRYVVEIGRPLSDRKPANR